MSGSQGKSLAMTLLAPAIPDQHTIFFVYASILLGALILAGAMLSFLGSVLHLNIRSIWPTYWSWWVLGPVTFAVIYCGRVPAILLFVVFAILSFREFTRATGLYLDRWMTSAGYLLIVAAGAAAVASHENVFMALPSVAIVVFVSMPIIRNRAQGQLHSVALAILGFIFIGWMFLHLALLADSPNATGYLLFVLVAVELSDVAAFTFGRWLGRSGKHPLRSQISPKKTWEGALAGLGVSMALPWALRFSFPYFGATQLILSGLIIGIGGQLGDLSISVIKRDLGIKDMGTMIPGHGGMLDRIDSLIYSAPLFQHMVNFFYKH